MLKCLLLLILCELWAGERLVLESALPLFRRPGRPISVSAVPFGPGIDIWRSCWFMGALMRSVCTLLGGIGRFVRCRIGANHCRLRHVGWEKCGHGLASRPQETAGVTFLDELLVLFRYLEELCPNGIVLLGFASRVPAWRLHPSGGAADLVTDGGEEVGIVLVEPCVQDRVGGPACFFLA